MAETVDKHIDDKNIDINIDINIDKNIDCNMVFGVELDLCFILKDFVEQCSFTCHYKKKTKRTYLIFDKNHFNLQKRSILCFYDSFFLSFPITHTER